MRKTKERYDVAFPFGSREQKVNEGAGARGGRGGGAGTRGESRSLKKEKKKEKSV